MKLHEALAVNKSLEAQATKVRTDLINTFEKKRHLFEEKRTVVNPMKEGEPQTTENQSDLQSRVEKELAWVSGPIARALDGAFGIASANCTAEADIVLEDGTIIAKGVPATFLLELEKRVAEIKTIVDAIPTLDPAKGFTKDPNRNAYVARPVHKVRTKKTTVPLVLYEATKEHPAQVQLVSDDVPVARLEEMEWSGLITPTEKAEMLARVEKMARAVKAARSRANEEEVVSDKIGVTILTAMIG